MNIYDFTVKDIRGEFVSLDVFRDHVLLIVNTASKCGYTYQYEQLEEIYQKFKKNKFCILAFPCNQFGLQEPGSSEEIIEFCTTKFSTSFPLFEKIKVRGKNAHPLFKYLGQEKPGLFGSRRIKWNFTKFLIDKEGTIVKRYAPNIDPLDLEAEIKAIL